jgi:hypothetical protein
MKKDINSPDIRSFTEVERKIFNGTYWATCWAIDDARFPIGTIDRTFLANDDIYRDTSIATDTIGMPSYRSIVNGIDEFSNEK